MSQLDAILGGRAVPVANVAAIRQIPTTPVLQAQIALDQATRRVWDFTESYGAGVADDGTSVLLPDDRTVLQSGRWRPANPGPTGPGVKTFADLAALREETAETFTDGDGVVILAPPMSLVWSSSTGASFVDDDGVTNVKLTETTVSDPGRFYPTTITGSSVQVATVVALQAMQNTIASGIYPKAIHLLAYAAYGDGGGGHFIVDPTDSTSTDNGGTLFVTAGGLRAKRQYLGSPSITFWGASPTGTAAANTTAIHAAWAATGGVCSMPDALFNITTLYWTYPGGRFTGMGPNSELRTSAAAGVVVGRCVTGVWQTGGYSTPLENITLSGGAPSTRVGGTDGLLVLDLSIDCKFPNIRLQDSAGRGLYVHGSYTSADIVTNGTFVDADDWTWGTGITLGTNCAVFATTGYASITQDCLELGNVYTIEFDLAYTAGIYTVWAGETMALEVITSGGHKSMAIACAGNTLLTILGQDATGSVSNVVAKPCGNNDRVTFDHPWIVRCVGSPYEVVLGCIDNNGITLTDASVTMNGGPVILKGTNGHLRGGDYSYNNLSGQLIDGTTYYGTIWCGRPDDTSLYHSIGQLIEPDFIDQPGVHIQSFASDSGSTIVARFAVSATGYIGILQLGLGSYIQTGLPSGLAAKVGSFPEVTGDTFLTNAGSAAHPYPKQWLWGIGGRKQGFYGADDEGVIDGVVVTPTESIAANSRRRFWCPVGGLGEQRTNFPVPPAAGDPAEASWYGATGLALPGGLTIVDVRVASDWSTEITVENETAAPITLPAGTFRSRVTVCELYGTSTRVALSRPSQLTGARRVLDSRWGVTPGDGVGIAAWQCQIDGTANAAQVTASKQPTVVLDAIGRRWVGFDGTQQFFGLVGTWGAATSYTIGFVLDADSGTGPQVLAQFGTALQVLHADGSNEVAIEVGGTPASTGATALAAQQLLLFVFNGAGGAGNGTCDVYRGTVGAGIVAIGSQITGLTIPALSGTSYLGAEDGTGSYFDGDMAEAWVVEHAFTSGERTAQWTRVQETWDPVEPPA
jgi:hypothetical protein